MCDPLIKISQNIHTALNGAVPRAPPALGVF
jgi:hypothetical protein